jgi:hypothetical protein
MCKVTIVLVIIGLLALDWAALHDITRGEPNVKLEYLTLFFSTLVFSLIILRTLINRRRSRKTSESRQPDNKL